MKNFKGNDYGEKNFRIGGSGKRQFGDRDRERPQMHEVICSDCGKKCEVPFKPTGDRPVYCDQCFPKHRESSSSNSSERRGFKRPRFQDKRMFDAICDKCGKRFELPFKPTGSRPVYCNACFDRSGSSLNKKNDRTVNQYKEQFDMLNAKLDRIIKALIPVVPAKEEKKGAIVKKKEGIVEKKEKAKKSKKDKKK